MKRSLNLVAGVAGIEVDPDIGEVRVHGDPSEKLLLVHLTNEGFEVEIVQDETPHPKH